MAITAGIVSWRHWHDGSAIDAHTGPQLGIVVGVEFAVAGIGAAILVARKRSAFIAPWIAFHSTCSILRVPLLFAAGVLVALGSWISVRVASPATWRSAS